MNREDALTLGRRLRTENAAASEARIKAALGPRLSRESIARGPLELSIGIRQRLAGIIYNAYYGEATPMVPNATEEEVLEELCQECFGASFAEVLEAYDRMLG